MTNSEKHNVICGSHHPQAITTICSYCKKIRNEEGHWQDAPPTALPSPEPTSLVSHGFCPTCARINFPDEYEAVLKKKPGALSHNAETAIIIP